MGFPLLLVISIPSSLGLGFVRALSETNPQIGSVGAEGVGDGVKVSVLVDEGVKVDVMVGVRVWVGVFV